jgi:hypothetical protein
LYSLFDELVNAPWLLRTKNVVLEVLFVKIREIRQRDGKGSFWRKGDSTVDRELLSVMESRIFRTSRDWLALLPSALPVTFGTKELGASLSIAPDRARKVLYTMSKAGLIETIGTEGNRKLYRVLRKTYGRTKKNVTPS